MGFYPGFDIQTEEPMGFRYGEGVFGPEPEIRSLDSIRKSLRSPACEGPEAVYSIAMDTGLLEDREDLKHRGLLFGVVTYAGGRLGQEPVRSQGHIHKLSPRCGWSTPEVYEIWEGKAVILMQETAKDDPGRCFAVHAQAGEVVIVPPGWAHATISADSQRPLTFGAWCDRDYGFEYDDVRAHKGLAFFPLLDETGKLYFEHNENYRKCTLTEKKPQRYTALGLEQNMPIYTEYRQNREAFRFVYAPDRFRDVWTDFIP